MKLQRFSPHWIKRVKSGFSAGIKTFVILFGIAGTIITAFAATGKFLSLNILFFIGLACTLISIIVVFVKGQLKHLPDQIILDTGIDKHYVATYCTAENLSEANSLTRPYYHHEYVSDSVAEMWRQKNPKGFVQITNSSGELSACFGVIALEQSFVNQFIKGRVLDNDLKSEDILNPAESKKSLMLYISGVVVRDPESPIGHRRACIMIWAIIEYLRKYYGFQKKRTFYALAVSKQSESLLKKTNFTIASSASQRRDKLNLYSLEMTRDNMAKISQRIGDYSQVCQCIYN